eukprot:1161848-Pelagomonas_calceolata.AAC.1
MTPCTPHGYLGQVAGLGCDGMESGPQTFFGAQQLQPLCAGQTKSSRCLFCEDNTCNMLQLGFIFVNGDSLIFRSAYPNVIPIARTIPRNVWPFKDRDMFHERPNNQH